MSVLDDVTKAIEFVAKWEPIAVSITFPVAAKIKEFLDGGMTHDQLMQLLLAGQTAVSDAIVADETKGDK